MTYLHCYLLCRRELHTAKATSTKISTSCLSICYCNKDELAEILWPNLLTSSKGGTENEKCLSRKKMYSESEIMWTDISRPMAYLIYSYHMLLFEVHVQCMDYISMWGRNVLKSAIISATNYSRRIIVEILHLLERFKGHKKNKNLSDTDISKLLIHMHEPKLKKTKSSILFYFISLHNLFLKKC